MGRGWINARRQNGKCKDRKRIKNTFKEEEKSPNGRFLQCNPRYAVKAKSQWHEFFDFAAKKEGTGTRLKKCSK
jgi:hypothetical protein